ESSIDIDPFSFIGYRSGSSLVLTQIGSERGRLLNCPENYKSAPWTFRRSRQQLIRVKSHGSSEELAAEVDKLAKVRKQPDPTNKEVESCRESCRDMP